MVRVRVPGVSPEEIPTSLESGPSPAVLAGFGCQFPVVSLPGGQGTSFRAGNIVLKAAGMEEEAIATAELFARLKGPGFRVPKPLKTNAGEWLCHGWSAWRFVDARPAGPNGGRWQETLDACRAFHAALAGEPRPAFLERRDDAWSAADRLAFGEEIAEPLPFAADTIRRLTVLQRPVHARSQLIHGDFAGNVLFADGEPPCVIDFSPYWRPVEFALAVIVSDAISWTAADSEIIDLCADVLDFDQWLVRATLRRVWQLDQHARRGREGMERYLAEYLPTTALHERRLRHLTGGSSA
jgi:uncharacterized protein (TIGR02569 family)